MNTLRIDRGHLGLIVVQIPLWSMNTVCLTLVNSDLCRSDSSMVDEYVAIYYVLRIALRVQIPLWSMNT